MLLYFYNLLGLQGKTNKKMLFHVVFLNFENNPQNDHIHIPD